jgi:aminotransferase
MTGFRVGYLVGPPDFTGAVAAIKATTSGACPVFSQLAALAALEVEEDPRPRYLAIYEGRRRALLDGFDELAIPYGPHGGGLFVWADVSRFGIGAEAFCYRLLEETGVLMFPGNSFGDRWQNWVRVSLLAPEESVTAAIGRIQGFVAGLEQS